MKLQFIFCAPLIFLLSCSKKKFISEPASGNIYYDKAFEYRENGQIDSAFIFFYKAKEMFSNQNDSLGVGKCLINMAIILTDHGDSYGGQETSIQAIQYLNENNPNHQYFLGANYNNLGIATHNLKQYSNSLKLYDAAIKLSTDPLDTRVYMNNKANSYKELGNYTEALKIYNQVLKGISKNQREYSRVLSNIAKTKWLQNPDYDASTELLKALKIRREEKDLWGQNASYAHLTDYYASKQPDTALSYARRMYQIANLINNPDDKLEALQKLIKLSPSVDLKPYFETYQKLRDSTQTARNAAKNQFALIRYETEKNKADNLLLQKDNAVKRYQIIILISGMLLITIVGILWYKKRKQRLELEAENSIRNSQLKTSKKVHDVVANGLYRVMTEIENQEFINKDHVLDKIEDLYEKSRDISYDKPELIYNHFHEKISALLLAFATERTLIAIAGNTPELWEKISPKVKYEIEHILQELLVNMKKHSKASNVVVKFEELHDQFFIHYTDNGIGMPKEMQFKNGLTNTGNRINSIHGEITFDTKVERGLKIQLSCPIS